MLLQWNFNLHDVILLPGLESKKKISQKQAIVTSEPRLDFVLKCHYKECAYFRRRMDRKRREKRGISRRELYYFIQENNICSLCTASHVSFIFSLRVLSKECYGFCSVWNVTDMLLFLKLLRRMHSHKYYIAESTDKTIHITLFYMRRSMVYYTATDVSEDCVKRIRWLEKQSVIYWSQ